MMKIHCRLSALFFVFTMVLCLFAGGCATLSSETTEPTEKTSFEFPMTKDIQTMTELSRKILKTGKLDTNDIPAKPFSADGGAVPFELTRDSFDAYEIMDFEFNDAGTSPKAVYDKLIAKLPVEIGEAAVHGIIDYHKSYFDSSFTCDDIHEGNFMLEGIMRDNFLICHDEQRMGKHDLAIVMLDDDGNVKQIKCESQNLMYHLTGGAVLSENVAFVCCQNMAGSSYDPAKLTVYRTKDGGRTWVDLDLRIPAESDDELFTPVYALSPVFDGDHGVMLVCYCKSNPEKTSGDYRYDIAMSWFETNDRGDTWQFVDSGIRYDPEKC
ncbi:MAG: hypothetical protein IKX16_09055 [Clostridia bacterium]|nr:hypothetical protein [Clostridia bacterium]